MSRLPSLGPRGEGWVAIQVVLFVVVFVAGFAGPNVDGVLRGVLGVAGAILVAGGGYLGVRGLLDLDAALTPLPHPRDGAELVERGSYRLVRHPIYGGIVIAAAGYALVAASLLAFAGALGMLVFFRLKSGREEAWLRDRYPAYEAYAARTKRMLPLLY
ncbi:MAG TPA: isoprenylcysteine carboxylmethyltransferase family protein [Candidatus Limnocylindrales bacterium]|nr:isoprenylcysteine carboxylmethyltransferase family protein [Candidatus Limnocylindrales bacterium]